MRGYWKLWHDVRARFVVALGMVLLQVWMITWAPVGSGRFLSPGLQTRPEPCRAQRSSDEISVNDRIIEISRFWPQDSRSAELDRGKGSVSAYLHDYRILASYCAAGERPNKNYADSVHQLVLRHQAALWNGLMPILMLFIGILLAVGPPFSGDRSEAAILTFSLPWARSRWMKGKAYMTVAMIVAIVAVVYFVTSFAYDYPIVDRLITGPGVPKLSPLTALPSLLIGLVGMSLGMAASMVIPNALHATIAAAAVAYVLAFVDVDTFGFVGAPGPVFLDMSQHSGFIAAGVVIAGTTALSWLRLRRTDF